MKTQQLLWSDASAIKMLQQALQDNQVVVGSSDTVLGLLAPLSEAGFQALNNLKQRNEKPYLVLIASVDKVAYFADQIPDYAQMFMHTCWPGPLTIIVKAKKGLPSYLVSPQGTIALRVPEHTGLLTLLQHFPGLFSTSANITGEPIPNTLEDLDPHIAGGVAYKMVDQGSAAHTVPSTLIDCSGPQLKVVREGAYPIAMLEEMIRG